MSILNAFHFDLTKSEGLAQKSSVREKPEDVMKTAEGDSSVNCIYGCASLAFNQQKHPFVHSALLFFKCIPCYYFFNVILLVMTDKELADQPMDEPVVDCEEPTNAKDDELTVEMATKIHRVIASSIIPRLHRILNQKVLLFLCLTLCCCTHKIYNFAFFSGLL